VLPAGAVIASCVGSFGVSTVNAIPVIINQQLQAYVPRIGLNPSYLKYLVSVSRAYFERICTA
jgi:type I restriction enzyme, S subunit